MKIVKYITYVLLMIASCVGAFVATQWNSSRFSFQQAAKTVNRTLVPFTLESQTVAPGPDGVLRVTEKRVTAVRGDGSEVWVGTLFSENGSRAVRKMIRPNGWVTTAIEAMGVKISMYLPVATKSGSESLRIAAGVDCRFSYEESRGERQIAGIRVSVSHYQQSPTYRRTNYRAIDYACVLVGTRIEKLQDGDWRLTVESTPIAFRGGEPAVELYEEGFYDKLKEMSPSQAQLTLATAMGIPESDFPSCFNTQTLSELDEDYYRHQTAQ